MKLPRETLRVIADGERAAKRDESVAMARELLALREEEERDGTVLVSVVHAGEEPVSGWFEPGPRRVPKSVLHQGGRITTAGRTYAVVSVEEPAADGAMPIVRVR